MHVYIQYKSIKTYIYYIYLSNIYTRSLIYSLSKKGSKKIRKEEGNCTHLKFNITTTLYRCRQASVVGCRHLNIKSVFSVRRKIKKLLFKAIKYMI